MTFIHFDEDEKWEDEEDLVQPDFPAIVIAIVVALVLVAIVLG